MAEFTPNENPGRNRADTVVDWPAGIVKLVSWPSAREKRFRFVPAITTSEITRSLPPAFVRVIERSGVLTPRAVLKTSREVRPSTSSVDVASSRGEPAGGVTVKLVVALPVLPAPSVAVTTMVWLPAVFTATGALYGVEAPPSRE